MEAQEITLDPSQWHYKNEGACNVILSFVGPHDSPLVFTSLPPALCSSTLFFFLHCTIDLYYSPAPHWQYRMRVIIILSSLIFTGIYICFPPFSFLFGVQAWRSLQCHSLLFLITTTGMYPSLWASFFPFYSILFCTLIPLNKNEGVYNATSFCCPHDSLDLMSLLYPSSFHDYYPRIFILFPIIFLFIIFIL